MQDIAPELLKRIQSDFRDKCRSDKELGKLIDKIDSGKGDFRDAQGFAEHIGDRLGEAYVKNLTEETLPNGRLYRNIAEKVITPTLERNHDLVCDASGKVEQALNEGAGIGLKVQVPELDQDRLNGLIDHVSDHEDPFTDEKAQELADLAENFTHHVVDAFIEKNADAHYAAGLSPKIERDAMAECCAWCLDLAGTYDYPLKDRSVYQRHKDCRCVVDYHPGNGKVQNVHSKEWRDETDSDILESRKTIGLEPLVDPAKVEQRKQAENRIEKNDNPLLIEAKSPFKNPDTPLKISSYDQSKHIVGGEKYNKYMETHEYPPSYLTISEEEIQKLVDKYHGTGILRLKSNGEIIPQEMIVDNDKVIGYAVNNIDGKRVEATAFKIHYSKDGTHIVPMYESQKEYWKERRNRDGYDWLLRQKS